MKNASSATYPAEPPISPDALPSKSVIFTSGVAAKPLWMRSTVIGPWFTGGCVASAAVCADAVNGSDAASSAPANARRVTARSAG